LISQVDYQGNKMINYSEFLAATIDVKNFLTESRLKAIFN
jgi:Ca2+-binding EF-hand superfamily protein